MSKSRDCVVCGEQFEIIPHRGMAITCGPACGKERRRQTKKVWRPTYAARWAELGGEEYERRYDRDWKLAHREANRDEYNASARARLSAKREHINALRRARHARLKSQADAQA
jgi:hypothetical protein